MCSLKRSNSFTDKVSPRLKMHTQQRSRQTHVSNGTWTFVDCINRRKKKWRHSFKKSNRVQNITRHSYICGIGQNPGNYMHLGNWIHLFPHLFAIRYRKYACYVRRGHSLALKCLKIKETSFFCPSRVQMHMVHVIQKRIINTMFEPEHGPECTALGCQALKSLYVK